MLKVILKLLKELGVNQVIYGNQSLNQIIEALPTIKIFPCARLFNRKQSPFFSSATLH